MRSSCAVRGCMHNGSGEVKGIHSTSEHWVPFGISRLYHHCQRAFRSISWIENQKMSRFLVLGCTSFLAVQVTGEVPSCWIPMPQHQMCEV